MASCGLEAVKEPLEEAASQLSLDSSPGHKNANGQKTQMVFEFFKVEMHLSWIFALQPTVSGKLMTYQLLLPVNRRYYLQYNDYSKVY